MRFRLSTILYVFALLAAGMATFGVWLGIGLAAVVLVIWWLIFSGRTKSSTILQVLFLLPILLIIAVILFELVMPKVQGLRETSRVHSCHNNLRQISLALQLYCEKHQSLPPAVATDSQGKSLSSWRVETLAYIEGMTIWSQWQRDLPYDDPANAALAKTAIGIYQCPSDPPVRSGTPECNYFAIIGPETAWANPKGTRLEEIGDLHKQTILLIEAAGLNIPWADPRDLSFQDAFKILTGRSPECVVHRRGEHSGTLRRFFNKQTLGVNVAFCDGTVRFLPIPLDEDLARALLTANGGEVIPPGTLDRLTEPQLDYARIYSLSVFVLLALVPGVVLWRRRNREHRASPIAAT
ncbi:DUF1559 family PulG-like putative transporter [Adhaeretor mobilis]|uniref:DUF1559 domain-containing protein n=1 Tax=Adhaeretor mobilis TaxID=1930276 RepID=A0A517N327_9BACT|nr:DUF1559 domain-containing protein [Adhaeretor mobilis]QDT01537.1 hypothetical protein HG15A2_48790 [Adhaeretor mobilis]